MDKKNNAFDVTNLFIMIVLFLLFAWPLWFVVIASFSNCLLYTSTETMRN